MRIVYTWRLAVNGRPAPAPSPFLLAPRLPPEVVAQLRQQRGRELLNGVGSRLRDRSALRVLQVSDEAPSVEGLQRLPVAEPSRFDGQEPSIDVQVARGQEAAAEAKDDPLRPPPP